MPFIYIFNSSNSRRSIILISINFFSFLILFTLINTEFFLSTFLLTILFRIRTSVDLLCILLLAWNIKFILSLFFLILSSPSISLPKTHLIRYNIILNHFFNLLFRLLIRIFITIITILYLRIWLTIFQWINRRINHFNSINGCWHCWRTFQKRFLSLIKFI